jgi:hypothetical protein
MCRVGTVPIPYLIHTAPVCQTRAVLGNYTLNFIVIIGNRGSQCCGSALVSMRNNAGPESVHTLPSQKVEFLHRKYISCVPVIGHIT